MGAWSAQQQNGDFAVASNLQHERVAAATGRRTPRFAELLARADAVAGRGGNTLVLQVRRNGEITILLLR